MDDSAMGSHHFSTPNGMMMELFSQSGSLRSHSNNDVSMSTPPAHRRTDLQSQQLMSLPRYDTNGTTRRCQDICIPSMHRTLISQAPQLPGSPDLEVPIAMLPLPRGSPPMRGGLATTLVRRVPARRRFNPRNSFFAIDTTMNESSDNGHGLGMPLLAPIGGRASRQSSSGGEDEDGTDTDDAPELPYLDDDHDEDDAMVVDISLSLKMNQRGRNPFYSYDKS